MNKKLLHISIWNEFLERQHEEYSLEENLRWFFEKRNEIYKLFSKKFFFNFFENLFLKFCRENSKCSENGLQILLAIQISLNIDDIDKKLSLFSKGINPDNEEKNNKKEKKLSSCEKSTDGESICWDFLMRSFFKKKIFKCPKTFNKNDFYKIIEKSVLLELNLLRSKMNLRKIHFFQLETKILYTDSFELNFSFGKEKLKEITEKIIGFNNFSHPEISTIKIKSNLNNNLLKCSIDYYK